MNLYATKNKEYFSNIRVDIISLLPKRRLGNILELGAGSGDTLVEIKRQGLAERVVGIELMQLPGTNQSNSLIDQLIIGDFEMIEPGLPKNHFDAVICCDVLEHLIDPWKVVERLSALLKPGGIILVSCPNIRYYQLITKVVIMGSFRYEDHGLFDKTHLRFFCKKDIVKLLSSDEMKIKSVTSSIKFIKGTKIFWVNLLTLGIFEQFLTLQYMVCSQRRE
jgi:2-polyprenyl-3-methyl-5-hydroxy-6-metoxy-1,4-benzoquinol methylase